MSELQAIPRLSEVGDRFEAEVASCVPQTTPKGEAVVFGFVGYSDTLILPRLGVDGALIRMNFYDKPERGDSGDGVVRYDEVPGTRLVFLRTPPTRGTAPGWRIEKPDAAPPVEAPRSVTNTDRPVSRPPVDADPEAKRQVVRDRYLAECVNVMATVVPELQKIAKAKKIKLAINFDVNAAVANQIISMEKRGCA